MNKEKIFTRVFHGPNGVAGAAYSISRLQRERGLQADFWVLTDHPRKKGRDICLHLERHGKAMGFMIRFLMFLFCLANYDIFHFYFGESLLPLNLDLPVLKLFRKRIVMAYAGSDIRLYKVDLHRHAYPTLLKQAGYNDQKDQSILARMRWHRMWVDKVIAPRGLYAYAKVVFPNEMISQTPVINIDVFSDDPAESVRSLSSKNNVLVIHAPTSQQKKGTEVIEKAIQDLQAEGLVFEYKRVEGLPYVQARQLIKQADVIVDQIAVGDIGNLTLEALVMGKTVCVYVMDEILKMVGENLPIVNINPSNLKEQLYRTITDQSLRRQLASEGPVFVRERIDIQVILREVDRLYGLGESITY